MKTIVLGCLAMLHTFAQLRTGEQTPHIRPEALRAHLTFIADDLLEGRGAGTRGFAIAAQYIKSQFEAMGLKPAGDHGTFFQTVRLRAGTVSPERTSLTVRRSTGAERLTFGQDFVIVTGSTENQQVSGEVVFAGNGIVAPEYGIDDYAGIDVAGKVVAYLRSAPNTIPAALRSHYSAMKPAVAAQRGAIAIIQLTDKGTESTTSFAGLIRSSKNARTEWLNPEARGETRVPSFTLNPERSRMLFENAPKTAENAFADARAGNPKGFALKVAVDMTTTFQYSESQSPNIVAMLPGVDAELKHEYVIYSAHADGLGIGEAVAGDTIYNGALDNASGTAGLIEIARAFTEAEQRPKRSILFLATAAEEAGLLGSDYFVHFPTVPLKQIVANLNVDGLNVVLPARDVTVFGGDLSTLQDAVARAARQSEFEVSPDPAPAQGMLTRGDQYAFLRAGIPAVYVAPGTKPSDAKTNALVVLMKLQARYHKPSDDLQFPFEYEAGVKHAAMLFRLGMLVADGERPKWKEKVPFGR